jgi:hypothetical protein
MEMERGAIVECSDPEADGCLFSVEVEAWKGMSCVLVGALGCWLVEVAIFAVFVWMFIVYQMRSISR